MKVIVTYGSGTPLKDCYSIVEGETYTDCRKEIFQITKGKYSMDYPYEQYAYMIGKI
jgi:hypothetical protein